MYLCPVLDLHFATDQPDDIVRKVAETCYRPFVAMLSRSPKSRATLSIDGALLARLQATDQQDIVDGLVTLAQQGQIELAAGANNNKMLTGQPSAAVEQAIAEHGESMKRFFGGLFHPTGLIPPELGYEPLVGETAAKLGYRWIVVDEIAVQERLRESPWRSILALESTPSLHAFCRDRGLSTGMQYRGFSVLKDLTEDAQVDPASAGYILFAVPLEIFGYHHRGYDSFLAEILSAPDMPTITLSGLFASESFPSKPVKLHTSSWSPWATLQY
jgi:predicted glycosyl hydrolase (DUF1957 family)